ncbi:Uncharacterised protein [Mycobacteroides abscessus subsp. massiliense]|nr:Uncharacterised protein [Mycobacteroides abscessus subsp. massiliense]
MGAAGSGAAVRDGGVSRSAGACLAGGSAGAGSAVARGAGASDVGTSWVGVLCCLVGSGAVVGSTGCDGGTVAVWRGAVVAGVS